MKIICKYVYACTVNIYWSLPKYQNSTIFYSCIMKYSPTTKMEAYLLCMQTQNIVTTYDLYAIHRKLYCNTIKNKKGNSKRSMFPALTAKDVKSDFPLKKRKYDSQSWDILKTNDKLKNLIFDRAMLFLKKLIYSIMSQNDYTATKNTKIRNSGKVSRPEAKRLRID